MRDRVRRFLIALTGVLLAAAPGGAVSTLQFRVQPEQNNAASVDSGGQAVIRVRAGTAAEARRFAGVVAERLNQLAEQGAGPGSFSVRKVAEGHAVYAGDTQVCLATRASAERAGLDVPALAESWSANLRRTFAGPYLSVPWSTILVPLGETFDLPVRGQPQGELFAAEVIGDGATALSGRIGGTAALRGAALGTTPLTVRRGPAVLALEIAVRLRAGTVPEGVEALVTGQGTSPRDARDAVWSELLSRAQRQPGTQLRIGVPDSVAVPGSVGNAVRVPVPVRIEGGDFIPYAATVPVVLRSQPWADQSATRLLVSNEPESVGQPQLLLRGQLPRGERTRLLYHHKTIASSTLVYEVRLLNPSDKPVRIHLRDAEGGPFRDEMWAGHQAVVGYWRDRLAGRGYVLRVPPRTAWVISSVATPPQQVLSGLSELTPLNGEGLEVQVVATTGTASRGPRGITGETRAPWSDIYLFPNPYKQIQAAYRSGGAYAFMSVGREAVKSVRHTPLPGNYGVIYDIDVTFESTEPGEGHYELVVSGDGGVARCALLVNGRLVETGMIRPMHQERLLDVHVPQGEKRAYRLRIMPQSGSNYPLGLIGRPFTRGWSGTGSAP